MKEKLNINLINQILHYSKRVSFRKQFQRITEDYEKWCPFQHGTKIKFDCYNANPGIQELLVWLEKYTISCKFLDCDRYTVNALDCDRAELKNPEVILYKKIFREKIKHLDYLINSLESDVSLKISQLTCVECIRLDEALVCFENFSFHAAVIMAVSAVESRIIEMIKRTSVRLYTSTFSKFTLGQLIQIFDDQQYTESKYKRIKSWMPEKHKPLVTLLNQYRIFSAHPKEDAITAQVAEAILHLAFTFMIDKKTALYSKKESKCAK